MRQLRVQNKLREKMDTESERPLSTTRILAAEFSETLFRLASLVAFAFGKDREGVEMRLRGAVLQSWRSQFRAGRQVRFVGIASRFAFGDRVCVYGNAYLNANGPNGAIRIGSGTHVDQYCVLQGQGGLTIGCDCAISSGVLIYSQTSADELNDGTSVTEQPTVYAPVVIGDRCWIGAGACILPGVRVGNNAKIGAGAVVLSDVAESSTVVGVPAKALSRA